MKNNFFLGNEIMKKIAVILVFLFSFIDFVFANINLMKLNNIQAQVNNEVVSLIDVNRALLEYIEQGIDINNKELQHRIILEQIQDKILEQLLVKFEMEINDADIKNIALNKIEEERASFPNENEYINYLRSQGLTLESYLAKLIEQIQNSKELKKKLAQEKFINAQIGNAITIPLEWLETRYDYSIILVKEQSEILDILLKLRRGEKFEELADKYSINKNYPQGRVGWKDINENLLAIEYYLLSLEPGRISGYFPLTSDNGSDFYDYAVIKLNDRKRVSKKTILDELSQKEFNKNYSELTPINKDIINGQYDKYIKLKERKLFAVRLSILKNDLLKKIWDSAFVSIKE